jgi:alkylhydroperoxidase/carboxymuconolactone decarboxylase family protein YurZ
MEPNEISDAPQEILPRFVHRVAEEHPDLWAAFQQLGAAATAAGPLTPRERRIVGLALSIGADSAGATHSHTRRGLAEGLTPDELEHVPLLAVTTLGWPHAIRALSWIRDITGQNEAP